MNPQRQTAVICLTTWWASERARGAALASRSHTRRCILPSRPYFVGASSTCSRQRGTRSTVTWIWLFHIPSRVQWVSLHKSSDNTELKQEGSVASIQGRENICGSCSFSLISVTSFLFWFGNEHNNLENDKFWKCTRRSWSNAVGEYERSHRFIKCNATVPVLYHH